MARPSRARGAGDNGEPMRDPAARFPDVPMAPGAAAGDAAIALGVVALFTLLPPVLRELVGGERGAGWYLWAVAGGGVVLATVSLLVRRRGQGPADIGLGPAPTGQVLRAAAAGVPLCYLAGVIAVSAVAAVSPTGLAGLAEEKGEFLRAVGAIPPGLVLPVSLFVGLYEEVLFRGFLLTRLRALFRSTGPPVLLTAALFGVLHFPQGVVGIAQTGAVGLVLALLAVRTRTVWAAILVHAAVDTISLTVSGLLVERPD